MKKCIRCNEFKDLNEFFKNWRSADGLAYSCKICRKEGTDKYNNENRDKLNEKNRKRYYENRKSDNKRTREYYKRNKEKCRNMDLIRIYGITIDQYNEMVEKQNNKCLICLKPETRVQKGKIRRLCVDHCHKTGKVRGLLCCNCNRGLGAFSDDIQSLLNAIQYLKSNNTM